MPNDRTLDIPVQSPDEDEFNRWPFSKRLANTIAAFDARAGAPVIGIYGRRGYGKSTVLNFIRTQLEEEHRESTENIRIQSLDIQRSRGVNERILSRVSGCHGPDARGSGQTSRTNA
jgi:ABC-type Na+ transport system ATPase subunit NatA